MFTVCGVQRSEVHAAALNERTAVATYAIVPNYDAIGQSNICVWPTAAGGPNVHTHAHPHPVHIIPVPTAPGAHITVQHTTYPNVRLQPLVRGVRLHIGRSKFGRTPYAVFEYASRPAVVVALAANWLADFGLFSLAATALLDCWAGVFERPFFATSYSECVCAYVCLWPYAAHMLPATTL